MKNTDLLANAKRESTRPRQPAGQELARAKGQPQIENQCSRISGSFRASSTKPAYLTYESGGGLKPYEVGKETYVPHAIKEDNCEVYYSTREEAVAKLRAMAFIGRRDVTIWGCGDDMSASSLHDEAIFLELRSQLRKNGMTEREQQLARQDLLHTIEATLWTCEPEGLRIEQHDDNQVSQAHVSLNGSVGIWPEIKNERGQLLRVVYIVQSLIEDDNALEYPTLKPAIIDALLRIERERIEKEYAQSEPEEPIKQKSILCDKTIFNGSK